MRDTSTWRGLLPTVVRDRWACVFMILNMPLIFIFQIFFILPYICDGFSTWKYLYSLLIYSFILCNFYANLYQLIIIDASGRNSDLPSVLKANFKYCHICRLNAPPRAYHCHICDLCILKRDHHCIFSGCCVGHRNHRFYLVGLIYCCLLAWLSLIFEWNYIWESLGGLQLSTIWYLSFPQFALIFRFINFGQFLMVVVQTSVIALALASSYLLLCQLFLIASGRTYHEFSNGLSKYYDYGIYDNFKDVLGKKWLLTLVNPLAKSPLLSDGVKIPNTVQYETLKNM